MEYEHCFYVHEEFTAGDVVMEVNSITIGGLTVHAGEETLSGYRIDVDYHVWIDTQDIKQYYHEPVDIISAYRYNLL